MGKHRPINVCKVYEHRCCPCCDAAVLSNMDLLFHLIDKHGLIEVQSARDMRKRFPDRPKYDFSEWRGPSHAQWMVCACGHWWHGAFEGSLHLGRTEDLKRHFTIAGLRSL